MADFGIGAISTGKTPPALTYTANQPGNPSFPSSPTGKDVQEGLSRLVYVAGGNIITTPGPPAPAGAVAPVASSAAEASHVLKASPGGLLSLTVSNGAVAGWVMLFDALVAPADGVVTPYTAPWQIPANGELILNWPTPLKFTTGIVVVFSSTGPTTKTASATAMFGAQVI